MGRTRFREHSSAGSYLTHQQVGALASAAGEFEPLVLLLAYTGLRWGEAVGLRIRDLDMLRRRANVAENAVQSGKRIFTGTPEDSQTARGAVAQFSAYPLGPPV
jgi:integrase